MEGGEFEFFSRRIVIFKELGGFFSVVLRFWFIC